MAPSVGVSPGYLPQALHYLWRGAAGLCASRTACTPFSSAVPGTSPLHEFEIAAALVKPAAVSHWSAMSYHGLTDQAPLRVFVLTTARSVPRRRGTRATGVAQGYRIGKVVYQFVQVKPARFFGTEDVWVGEARIPMTDPERTLLDGLMNPQYCGGFAEVLHAFDVRHPKLDVERIIRYALALDAATAKRLGWILQERGVDPSRWRRCADCPSRAPARSIPAGRGGAQGIPAG